MRTEFIRVITKLFAQNEKTVLILGDIGVHGFQPLAEKYPDRVINIGICEQATIGIASGMAKEGLCPIFYTIAPFAVERCFEQIKIDIGYQNLPITIVSVGGSYDYSALGCTHHCPGDVALLKTVPNMEIFAPAYTEDLEGIFDFCHGVHPLYIRIPEKGCEKTPVFKTDTGNGVIALGDTVDNVINACNKLYVAIFCSSSLSHMILWEGYKKIAIIEPWYEGTMLYDIQKQCPHAEILSIGIRHKFLTNYGTKEEHDRECGLDVKSLKTKLTEFFNG